MLTLLTEPRNVFGKGLKAFREKGKLPAVVYGRKKKPHSVFVNLADFKKVWKKAGESTLVELSEPKANVVIHDIAVDPMSDEPIHVDFYAVDMDKPITASVPVVFKGVSGAVKDLGGVLVKVMHEVEIEALPQDLPHELHVDISLLKTFEDRVSVKDIGLPKGVKATSKAEEVIALVEPPREEVEATPALTIADIEVEKKGKKEEEGAEEEIQT
ncbi:MAG TPA: 50S ribosomal protein L25 [Candidatus Paceibacterota bacterium]